MANVFDQFDPPSGNVFDKFDQESKPTPAKDWNSYLKEAEGKISDNVTGLGLGLINGASRIGNTLINASSYIPRKIGDMALGKESPMSEWNRVREQGLNQWRDEHQNDPMFGAGTIASEIAGTAGVGGVLGGAAKAVPMLAKYAPVVESGGFTLGNAATGSKVANAGIRALGGALVNGTAGAMIDPSNAVESALVGSVIPGSIGIGGAFGNSINNASNNLSRYLMQSALKPPKGAVMKGAADKAIDSMLQNGINVTKAGLGKTQLIIDDLNNQISNAIQGSAATINKSDVIPYLSQVKSNAGLTPSHAQDLQAIDNIETGFMTMPSAPNADIAVSQAQAVKQAIYKKLKDEYGKLGSAEVEANKAIARGLKDNIANKVPEISGLNAKESGLIEAQKLLANRLAVSGNKDPMGLGALALANPKAFAAFMLNRSELIKSLGARSIYNTGNFAGNVFKSLPAPIQNYGLLGAPAVLTSSP